MSSSQQTLSVLLEKSELSKTCPNYADSIWGISQKPWKGILIHLVNQNSGKICFIWYSMKCIKHNGAKNKVFPETSSDVSRGLNCCSSRLYIVNHISQQQRSSSQQTSAVLLRKSVLRKTCPNYGESIWGIFQKPWKKHSYLFG